MADLRELLDDALDDLPRYMAVVNQSENGWLPGDPIEGPSMVTCVTVDDVREMLRRAGRRATASAPESPPPAAPAARDDTSTQHGRRQRDD